MDPPRFRRNFTCSALLRIHSRETEVSTTGLLPCYRRTFSRVASSTSFLCNSGIESYNPGKASWFGAMFRFDSPVTQDRICFSSVLQVLRMFHSLGLSSLPYCMSDKDTIPLRMVGFPIRKSSDKLTTAPRSISALVPVIHSTPRCSRIHRCALF